MPNLKKVASDAGSIFVVGSFVVACSARVAQFPAAGESLEAEAVIFEAGGKGFNLSVGIRRLGRHVTGVLAVGDDIFARLAEEALQKEGLPVSMLRRFAGQTGAGLGFNEGGGDNRLAIFPGANRLLAPADIATADLAHASLVLAQFEVGNEVVTSAFERARTAGAETLLNPSPFRAVSPRLLACTSILVVNEVEARHMASAIGVDASEDGHETLADHALRHGPHTMIITLGRNGVIAYRRGHLPLSLPAFDVTCVDALGAGDAFTAGFSAGYAAGAPFEACLMQGMVCGALCVGVKGVLDGLPTKSEVDVFLMRSDGISAVS